MMARWCRNMYGLNTCYESYFIECISCSIY